MFKKSLVRAKEMRLRLGLGLAEFSCSSEATGDHRPWLSSSLQHCTAAAIRYATRANRPHRLHTPQQSIHAGRVS